MVACALRLDLFDRGAGPPRAPTPSRAYQNIADTGLHVSLAPLDALQPGAACRFRFVVTADRDFPPLRIGWQSYDPTQAGTPRAVGVAQAFVNGGDLDLQPMVSGQTLEDVLTLQLPAQFAGQEIIAYAEARFPDGAKLGASDRVRLGGRPVGPVRTALPRIRVEGGPPGPPPGEMFENVQTTLEADGAAGHTVRPGGGVRHQ